MSTKDGSLKALFSNRPLELFEFTFDQLEHEAKVIDMLEDVMHKPKEPEFCSHCELDEQEKDRDNE